MSNVVYKVVFNLTNIAILQNVEGVFGKCNLESFGLEGGSLYVGWLKADELGSFPGGTGKVLFTAVDSYTRCILGGPSVGLKQLGRKSDCSAVSCDGVNNVCYILWWCLTKHKEN
jgi:hypothetical protein